MSQTFAIDLKPNLPKINATGTQGSVEKVRKFVYVFMAINSGFQLIFKFIFFSEERY